MDRYIVIGGEFFRYSLDANGKPASPRVPVDAAEAAPRLLADYENGNLQVARKDGQLSGDAADDAQILNEIIRPLWDRVYSRDVPLPDRVAELRRLYGDGPKTIRLVTQSLGEAVAQAIWGDKAVRYGQNDRSPDTPVATPANVVIDSRGTQGQGPPPPSSAPDASNGQPPLTATSPQSDPRTGGDPLILFSGQLFFQVTDLEVAARGLHFTLTRTYLNQTVYRGPLGYGWDHSYNLWLREEREIQPDGSFRNLVYRSNGQVRDDRYQQILATPVSNPPHLGDVADAAFEGPAGFFDQLTKSNGRYVLEMFSGVRIHYTEDLLAERIVDLNGNEVLLAYDIELRLRQVTDPVGKVLTFDYDELNQLRQVRDVEGKRSVLYTFGDNGDLAGVDLRPDGETACETDYEYAGANAPPNLQHNLTRVINPLGQVVLETEYGLEPGTPSYNRVIRQFSESGLYTYDYQPVVDNTSFGVDLNVDPVNFPRMSTTVSDSRNHVVEHVFNEQGNVIRRCELLLVNGLIEQLVASYRYNLDGSLIEERHPDGGAVEYRYGREEYADLHGGDASGATAAERATFGQLLRRVEYPRTGFGEARRIVTEFTYSAARRVASQRGPYYAGPALHALSNQTIGFVSYGYDARSNLTAIHYPDVELPTGGAQTLPVQRFEYDTNGTLTNVILGAQRVHYEYFPDLRRSGFVMKRTDDADGAALVTQYDCDVLGRILRVTTPFGAIDEQDWNGFDLLKEARRADPASAVTRSTISYTANRQIAGGKQEIGDALGNAIQDSPLCWAHRYDSYGRLIESTSGPARAPQERRRRIVYDADGLPGREFDSRGVETRTVRDELGRTIELIRAFGRPEQTATRFAYNAAGELVSQSDSLGHVTFFMRDAFGRIHVIRDPDGNEVEHEYDAADRLTRTIVRGPHPETKAVVRWSEAAFVYDAVGRLIRLDAYLFEPGTGGPERVLSTLRVHDEQGRLREVHDPTGAVWSSAYDGLDRPTIRRDPDGNETRWSYDDAARTATVTATYVGEDSSGSPGRHVVRNTIQFDLRGRPVLHTDEAGNQIRIAFDTLDLPGRRVDAAGTVTSLERNVFGEAVGRTDDAAGHLIHSEFVYDENGNLTRLRDPGGNETVWTFDALDRITGVTRGGNVTREVFDSESRSIKSTDENGVTLLRAYSPAGRLTAETPDLSSFIPGSDDPAYRPAPTGASTYVYAPDGSIAEAANDVANVKISFDSLGRMVKEDTDGVVVKMSYDDAGRTTRLVYPAGRELQHTYSAGGFLQQVIETATGSDYPGGAGAVAGRVLSSARRVGDRVTAINLPTLTAQNFYDAARRPVGVDWIDPASGTLELRERRLYGPRGEGRIEQLGDRLHISKFDALGRQTNVDEHLGVATIDVSALAPPVSEAAFKPGAQGNEDTLPMPPLGAATSRTTYVLDDATNRRQVTELQGGTATTTDYVVAPFDQYRKVGSDIVLYDAAGNTIGVGTQRFQFDAYHRLSGTSGMTVSYDALGRPHAMGGLVLVHAGIEPIEWRSAGQAAAQLVSAGNRYLHLAIGGADYNPLADLSGSIVAWADAGGQVVGRSIWDPFGRLLARTGIWPLPLGFRGQWRDEASGIDLLFARAYHPGLGRFLQRDPVGYLDSLNLYAYARHAPSTYTDVFGFSSTEIHWGTVAWKGVKKAGVGIGLGLGAGFAVTVGIVSTPFVLAVGGLALIGTGLRSFFLRADEAFDAGKSDFGGRAALAAAGDAVGISGLWEGATGRDAVTDRRLGSVEREERLSDFLGTVGAYAAGGLAYNTGGAAGRGAIRASWLDPYSVPSIARPTPWNPSVFGRYRNPLGLTLGSGSTGATRPPVVPPGAVDPVLEAAKSLREGELFSVQFRKIRWRVGDPPTYPSRGRYPKWPTYTRRLVRNLAAEGKSLPLDPISPKRGRVPIDHIIGQRFQLPDPHNAANLWICDSWGWLEHAFFDPFAQGLDILGRGWRGPWQ